MLLNPKNIGLHRVPFFVVLYRFKIITEIRSPLI
jgi:hypothetical protein